MSAFPEVANRSGGVINTDPPDSLSDKSIIGWLRHDVLFPFEAMSVLQGKAPRVTLAWGDELKKHFPGIKDHVDEIPDDWDTPDAWLFWAASKGIDVDPRAKRFLTERRLS